jgi:hypothetical protein
MVRFSDRAHLDLRIECKSESQAAILQPLFEITVPITPAGFEYVVVEGADERVDIGFDGLYPEIPTAI